MHKILLFFLIVGSLKAGVLKLKDGHIMPLKIRDYSLAMFLGDYANVKSLRIALNQSMVKEGHTISLHLNKKIPIRQLHFIVQRVLDNYGFSLIGNERDLALVKQRDIVFTCRYLHFR